MNRLAVAFALCLMSASASAAPWTDWWLTPDQQGERLLTQGKPADAARTFSDPRRRAYAQIRAGEFEEAAKRLAPLHDPQSQYNRGNALARAGDLKQALSAYDAALAHTSANTQLARDARHNRDLVAKQLEKNRAQSRAQSGASQGKNSKQSGNGQKAASKGGDASGQEGEPKSGGNTQSKPANNDSSTREGDEAQRAASASQPSAKASSSPQKQTPERASAQDDAAAALAKAQPKQGTSARTPAGANANSEPDAPTRAAVEGQPPSEQTLALDQWLRQIPDDPAGLLRRKFLVEHMRKEQESRR